MAIQHTIARQYSDQSKVAVLLQETITGNAEINLDDAALAVVNNHQYTWSCTRANLQALMIYASGPVTVYTNNPSGSTPQDTIPISAGATVGQVLIWTLATDGLSKCPFSGNVTSIYVTNAGSGAVQFKIRAITNE